MTPLNVHAEARPIREGLFPIFLGVWAASVALAPTLDWKLILLVPGLAAAIVSWILYRPSRWLYLLFFCLLALPPIPFHGAGDSGVHVAPVAGGIGILIGLLRIHAWRNLRGRLPLAFAGFLAVLLVSTGFAALYSGADVAAGSLVRVLLFALGVYVFAYIRAIDPTENAASERMPAMRENAIAQQVVDAAYRVHTVLGPGLLESMQRAIDRL